MNDDIAPLRAYVMEGQVLERCKDSYCSYYVNETDQSAVDPCLRSS
jgi:hypothetical protein